MTVGTDIIVLAAAKAKPGKEAELERAWREVAAPTRAQPGCVQFSLLRSTEDRAIFVGFERWESEEDHQTHLQGAHMQKLMGRMAELLAEPLTVVAYEVLDD